MSGRFASVGWYQRKGCYKWWPSAMHPRGVPEVRRIHLQVIAVQSLSGNGACGEADGLSSRADGSKPNHEFVLGL